MRCPRCQADNRYGVRFCEDCGAPLPLRCPHCGAEVLPEKRFCGACGGSLTAQPTAPAPSATAATSAERFISPQTYTPEHLAERILTSRSALEGERKQVTVLFADLKGSMELLADRDPEDARRILDPVLERMMDAVHRYEGTVNQVMGDGIMALFGAPLAHEDHAVRACYAALRMQEVVNQYAAEVLRSEGVRIQIRVGLNSGEVVVRSIGSDLRMDYTAVGQTTHLAARMEQTAVPGSILIAPDTLRLAEGYVHVHALGPIPIKGLGAPVEAYEVLGAGASRTRLQAAAARGLTRFVGRAAEIEVLRQTLEQAGGGRGQVVALMGEPGVGKSRLTWEFTHSHRAQGWLVLESGSVSYGKATPWLPVTDLLKTYCGIEAADDHRRMREKLTGKLLTLDPALGPTLPALLALLDVPTEDPAWEACDPPQRRQRTLDAVKRLLLRESQIQPLIVVFEDLHWIDSETQALLDSLVDCLPTTQILLLLNYRPEYEHNWHRKTYFRELRLDPLPPRSAEELLQALLGDDASLLLLKRLLIERTEGNPFFLEESVRTLLETGVLAGEPGTYRLGKPVESTQVPATVQAVLAARIDRLVPEDKRLLQSAAVIGKDVSYVLLQAIAELSEDGLRQRLADLQAAEFLYETSLFPELEYTFKHALTHEVAYGSLLQDRRRALHARIVAAMEDLYPGRLTEHVERLGHHALRGEVWDKAVGYLREAGAKAAGRSAHRDAVACFEQALAALGHVPESRETREQTIDLRLELRISLQALGEFEQLVEHLREAEALADDLDDRRRLGRVSVYRARYSWYACDFASAVELGQRALSAAGALPDLALQILANNFLGDVYTSLADYDRAQDLFERNLAVLHGDLLRERFGGAMLASVFCSRGLAFCRAERGEFLEAAAHGAEAVHRAEAGDDAQGIIEACTALGHVYLAQGEPSRAIPIFERGLELCQTWNTAVRFPAIASHLGYAYALVGRVAEGLPLLEEAIGQAAARPALVDQSQRLVWLSEAYHLADRAGEAAPLAGRALQLAREHQERGHESRALWLLGEIAAHAEPPDITEAEGHYREALALAEELGMRPLVAHCHLGLGTLHHKIGRWEQARAELEMAVDMYRAMDMTFWLARAEAALTSTG